MIHVSSLSAEDYRPLYDDPPWPGRIEQSTVEGELNGQIHWIRETGSDGRLLKVGLFTQDPATFPLTWPGDETIIVLEGEVRIELVDTGEVVELKEGDIASFPKGARSVWTVKSPFKEFFVLSG